MGYKSNDLVVYCLGIVNLVMNSILVLLEIIQLSNNGAKYFKEPWNILDILRFLLVYASIIFPMVGATFSTNAEVIMFFLVWLLLIKNLEMFKAIRYQIQMLEETILGITSFLIVLFFTIIAYCHITIHEEIYDNDEFPSDSELENIFLKESKLHMASFTENSLTSMT